MNLFYSFIFFFLSFFMHSIFFGGIVSSLIYYIFQSLFLLLGIYLKFRNKGRMTGNIPWFIFALTLFFSITGALFYSDNFERDTIFSYINGIVMFISSGLYFSNSAFFTLDQLNSMEKWFSRIAYLVFFIAVFQFFGILELEGVRNNTTFIVSGLPVHFLRATSVFMEPSGWAKLFSLYFLFEYFKGFKPYSFFLVFFSLIMSLSNTGIVLVFFVFIAYLFQRPFSKKKLFFIFCTSSLIVVSIILFIDKLNLIFAKFSDLNLYRNLAPIEISKVFFSNLNVSSFFGHGVNSIQYAVPFLQFAPEDMGATTSHNSIVDILYELGLFGIFIFLFTLNYFFKNKIMLFLLFFVFASQTGYRTYQFTFCFFMYYFFVLKNKKKLVASSVK